MLARSDRYCWFGAILLLVATTTLDELGQAIAQTDQAGITKSFEYDALGRLTAVIDALDQRTEYRYDLAGNLIEIEDANDHATQYEYDELNRRTATILPRGQRSETAYDPVGNVVSLTDFNGDTIIYSYDEINQLIAKQFPEATKVEYTYTPTGQMETVTDQRGTTTYRYDVADRLIERVDPDGQFVGYDYDAAGNRIEVITPGGSTTYSYNANGWLLTVTYPNEGVTSYSYNTVGNLVETEFPNGTVETRSYDDLNRLVFLENTGPDGVISSYRYDLDAVGNRLSVEEDDGRQVSYDYDELYRLESEMISVPGAGERTISYTYDPVGNRLTRNDSVEGTTSYVYNDNDWLLSETLNGEVTEYGYDENGNRLSQAKNGIEEVVYQWDYENRLVGADGNQEVEYRYDDNGVRVAAIVDGVETRYLIDANRPYAQVLEEYNPQGNIQASYVYGLDLISQERSEQRSFYHVDGLGSTRVLTDDGGGVTDSYDYDAYGVLIASTGGTVNDYLYTGEQFDPNLGDYYLRARYYEPTVGRFLSRDPFEGFLIEPLSLAKYPYVHGNPVNATDPSGLITSTREQTVAFAILAVLAVGTWAWYNLNSSLEQENEFPDYLIGASPEVANIARAPISVREKTRRQIAKQEARILSRVSATLTHPSGYPIIVWGRDLPAITRHTYLALIGAGSTRYTPSGNTGIAPNLLTRMYPKWSMGFGTSWKNSKWSCGAGLTGGSTGNDCDEYPYDSTIYGGPGNYDMNRVSLRAVPTHQNSAQGSNLSIFYGAAPIVPNDPILGTFIVGFSFRSNSYWINRNGNVIPF